MDSNLLIFKTGISLLIWWFLIPWTSCGGGRRQEVAEKLQILFPSSSPDELVSDAKGKIYKEESRILNSQGIAQIVGDYIIPTILCQSLTLSSRVGNSKRIDVWSPRCAVHEGIFYKLDYMLNQPSTSINIGSTGDTPNKEIWNCIEVFGIEHCDGVSIQFFNVSHKSLMLNTLGKTDKERKRLLNFHLWPRTFEKCVPLENWQKQWQDDFLLKHPCRPDFQIEISKYEILM